VIILLFRGKDSRRVDSETWGPKGTVLLGFNRKFCAELNPTT
jgi:hypothetical protein